MIGIAGRIVEDKTSQNLYLTGKCEKMRSEITPVSSWSIGKFGRAVAYSWQPIIINNFFASRDLLFATLPVGNTVDLQH